MPPTDCPPPAPAIMLVLSRDHQLFFEAYDDYSFVNETTKTIETTYNDQREYFGYFDKDLCYNYKDDVFRPISKTLSNKNAHRCGGEKWSGNFLNWATMTRMDVVRKVLYGGYRVKDKAAGNNQPQNTPTVLERAYLPTDAHSFAKYYDGADIGEFTPYKTPITLCNTTKPIPGNGSFSESNNEPPLLRIAQGDYRLWSASERFQCMWKGEFYPHKPDNQTPFGQNREAGGKIESMTSPPSEHSPDKTATNGRDLNVRVEVCTEAFNNANDCEKYPSGKYQPIGMLQRYGSNGDRLFGLMTGTYQKNQSGGVLRKHPSSFADELNSTDGSFAAKDPGIVSTLNKLRITRYLYGEYGNSASVSGSGIYFNISGKCRFLATTFNEGDCPSWGNPIGEIFGEAVRYLGGAGGPNNSYFQQKDQLGLLADTWDAKSLITNDTYCRDLVTFVVNTSVPTNEEIVDLSGVMGGDTSVAKTETNNIGLLEKISGKYFVGTNGTHTAPFDCSAKTVNSLGDVKGICPEAPNLGGSYLMAGAAKYAYQNNFYPQYSADPPNKNHNIKTYGIDLSTNLPEIKIVHPLAGRSVTLMPAFKRTTATYKPSGDIATVDRSRYESPGALVDFKIIQQTNSKGTFYVAWEDTEQGSDYDNDVSGTISYELTGDAANPKIVMSSKIVSDGTQRAALFGYFITGTKVNPTTGISADGFHATAGVKHAIHNTAECPQGIEPPTVQIDQNWLDTHTQAEAQKRYGGCAEKTPVTHLTFDIGGDTALKTTLPSPLALAAKYGSDKNYYVRADSPNALADAVKDLFPTLSSKTSSGSEVAIDYASQTGEGVIYQTLYDREYIDPANPSVNVKWTGDLYSLYMDEKGQLREASTDGSGTMGTAITYVKVDGVTAIKEIESGKTRHLRSLKPLWSARNQLALVSDVENNRTYTSSAKGGRFIKTWIDRNGNHEIDNGEYRNFEVGSSGIGAGQWGIFDVTDEKVAYDIIRYTRGQDIDKPGWRTRRFFVNGKESTARLGDIVHSAPTVVGAPGEKFDIIYQDTGYYEFRKTYKERRRVLYVGANDGLLHAFNGGVAVYDQGKFVKISEKGHPLGSELWAYAPMNLLPHLRWLKEPNYGHTYYVDGKPKAFDARVFSEGGGQPNADHVKGWGTLLVVGMRLGGGEITLDTGGPGFNDISGIPSKMGSAYMIFDVTDPEKEPHLITEFRLDNSINHFTTSQPAIIKVGSSWYLVIGSGPTQLSDATSSQPGMLYFYDLQKTVTSRKAVLDKKITLEAKGFVGDPAGIDWDLDPAYNTDALYVGTHSGGKGDPSGRLFKITLKQSENSLSLVSSVLLDTKRPILARPVPANDELGNRWIYANSGKQISQLDMHYSAQQGLFGIVEKGKSLQLNDLVNVDNITITKDGTLKGYSKTFNELRQYIRGEKNGWYLNYPVVNNTATRGIASPFVFGKVVFANAFLPITSCASCGGKGSLYGVYYGTGTALPTTEAAEPEMGPIFPNTDNARMVDVEGLPTRPMVKLNPVGKPPASGKEGCQVADSRSVTVLTSTSNADVSEQQACTAGAFESREVSWREVPTH